MLIFSIVEIKGVASHVLATFAKQSLSYSFDVSLVTKPTHQCWFLYLSLSFLLFFSFIFF